MIWQDIVVSIANLLFTYSTAHQVYYGFRKKKGLLTLTTAGLTSIGLYTIAIAFFTLSLYFSTTIVALNATLWLILFIQRIIYKKA
jgi:hypothetical protein